MLAGIVYANRDGNSLFGTNLLLHFITKTSLKARMSADRPVYRGVSGREFDRINPITIAVRSYPKTSMRGVLVCISTAATA
jgi:hypothetical protein